MISRENNLRIFYRWVESALLAVAFLTRIPIRLSENNEKQKLADVMWAFPLVGVFVGGVASFAMWIGYEIGLSPLVCGLIAVATQALITGALHEDGLADVADGFGGGQKIVDKFHPDFLCNLVTLNA